MKRSPSHSPPTSYPLGRAANNTCSNSSNSSTNSSRQLAPGQQYGSGVSDTSLSSSGTAREVRTGQSGSASNSSMGGPVISHNGGGSGGNGGDTSGFQSQVPQVGGGKYGTRDTVHQVPSGASRWSHINSGGGNDDVVGIGVGGAEAGMQAGCPPGSSGGAGSLCAPGMAGEGKVAGGSSGSASGDGGGLGTSGRGYGAPGDGVQSLPSLKASGLLDSWGSASRSAGSAETQKQTPNGSSAGQQPPLATPRRTSTSGGIHSTMLPASQHANVISSDVAELRPSTTLGMPVGMPWLANESR